MKTTLRRIDHFATPKTITVMRYINLLFLLCCLTSTLTNAQDRGITSVGQLVDSIEMHLEQTDYEEAAFLIEQVLNESKRLDDKAGLAEGYFLLGRLERLQDNWKFANDNFQKSLDLWDQIGDKSKLGEVLKAVSLLNDERGQYAQAKRYAQQSIDIFEALNDSLNLGRAYVRLANSSKATKDFSAAKDYYEKAGAIFKAIGHAYNEALTNYQLGFLNYELNQYLPATSFLNEALTIVDTMDSRVVFKANVYNLLGMVHYDQDQFDQARTYYEKAKQLALEAGDQSTLYDLYSNLATLALYSGQYQEGEQLVAQAEEILADEADFEDYKYLSLLKGLLNELQSDAFQRRQRNLWIISISLCFFLALLAYGMYKRAEHRKSAHLYHLQMKEKEHQHALELQRREYEKEMESSINSARIKVESQNLNGERKERKRIARVLHDTVSSQLAATRWLHEENISKFKQQNLAVEDMEKVLEMLNKGHEDLRQAVKELEKEYNTGVNDIKKFCRTISQFSNIEITFLPFGLDRSLPNNIGEHLYNIILTLATNVLVHAKAQKLSINVNRLDDEINILFEDNGIGFDPEKTEWGSGLTNIEERVQQMDGNWHIDSKPGHGTNVTIRIPL